MHSITRAFAAAALLALAACSGTSSSSSSSSSGSSASSSSSSSGSSSGSGSSGSASTGSSGSSSSGSSGGSSGTPADWSCLGHEVAPVPTSSSTPFTAVYADPRTGPQAGLQVKLCHVADTTCANPDDTGTTDSTGTVTLTAPLAGAAYVGYLDAVDPSGNTPELLVYPRPFVSDPNLAVEAVGFGDFNTLAALIGTQDFATHGALDGRITDCSGARVVGATASLSPTDANTHLYYVYGVLPSTSQPDTDASGQYLAINVPPGTSVQATAFLADGGVTAVNTVMVKAGAVTAVDAAPNQ
ncbi:MAG: carboxypeptidase regulatory-like domain-containing protein [Deltaproteobacteria bacterium]|nr:carboxypeptidase regulatory-like domain-containing protein [Deltaproteobacteria bacterium]